MVPLPPTHTYTHTYIHMHMKTCKLGGKVKSLRRNSCLICSCHPQLHSNKHICDSTKSYSSLFSESIEGRQTSSCLSHFSLELVSASRVIALVFFFMFCLGYLAISTTLELPLKSVVEKILLHKCAKWLSLVIYSRLHSYFCPVCCLISSPNPDM